jgi:Arc/MetJ-type ribon-helix-helix transcriptional regulator
MKMITLFLPEKYLEMLDTLVAENLYPNRSEALRIATFKFLHESVDMLKAIPTRSESGVSTKKVEPSPIDAIIADLEPKPANKSSTRLKTSSKPAPTPSGNADPFDELVGSIQAV